MGRRKKLSPERREERRLAKLEIENKISDIKNKISELDNKYHVIMKLEYDYKDITVEVLDDLKKIVNKLDGFYIIDPFSDITKIYITKHEILSLNIIKEYEKLNNELLELE